MNKLPCDAKTLQAEETCDVMINVDLLSCEKTSSIKILPGPVQNCLNMKGCHMKHLSHEQEFI